MSLHACSEHDVVPPPQSTSGEIRLSKSQVAADAIEITKVDDRDLEDTLTAAGRIAFDDMRIAHAISPVAGRVVDIRAALGQHVKKGDVLAVIESPEIGQASADLLKAKADLVATRLDAARAEDLYRVHAISQRELEQARNAYSKAAAEYERAKKKADLLLTGDADVATQRYTLRAGIDGEIIARTISPGVEVAGLYDGGSATDLFTLAQRDSVWALADVFEVDVLRVHVGAPARVTIVGRPGPPLEGTIDWISAAMDSATHTAKVRCTLANPTGDLRAEMYATLQIVVDAKKELATPRSSIVRLGDQTFAFTVVADEADGVRFARIPVHVDEEADGAWLPVLGGLDRGTRVVSAGAMLLSGMN
jgi:cobalt-zinc-cadmium efflux system membrane fusion protein